jgi:hypothetical protein
MRIKKWLAFMCILLIQFCCSSGDKELKFAEGIEYFEDDFTAHFPKRVPEIYSQLVVSQDLSGSHPHVWLLYYMEQSKLDSIQSVLEDQAVAIYNSNDSCLLVIDKHLNESNWIDYDKWARVPKKLDYGDRPCHKDKLPVPNFYSKTWRETDETLTGLENYKLYVLVAKSGVFMDSTKLPNGLYTPEGWEHGYSKGVAIDKQNSAIIYWADIW